MIRPFAIALLPFLVGLYLAASVHVWDGGAVMFSGRWGGQFMGLTGCKPLP